MFFYLLLTYHRSKEEEEAPKLYELQNIDKTIFDDETSASSTLEKIDEVSHDIQKATTVETRAIYLCRRGALLRKVVPHIVIVLLLKCVKLTAWKIC